MILVDPIVRYSADATRGLPGQSWCHMVSDTSEEDLHAFAARLGCRRGWFQPSPPHYDLMPSRRARAVKLGAIEVTSRELALRNYGGLAKSGRSPALAAALAALPPIRVRLVQTREWDRRREAAGNLSVYSDDRCCMCFRAVGADPIRLTLTRTNDGEWYVVHPNAPVLEDERHMGDPHFVLPIGAECLRKHPEFLFGIVANSASAVPTAPTSVAHGPSAASRPSTETT